MRRPSAKDLYHRLYQQKGAKESGGAFHVLRGEPPFCNYLQGHLLPGEGGDVPESQQAEVMQKTGKTEPSRASILPSTPSMSCWFAEDAERPTYGKGSW